MTRDEHILLLISMGRTLEEIGQVYNISRQRVHQIIQRNGVASVKDIRESRSHGTRYLECKTCNISYPKGTFYEHVVLDEHIEARQSNYRAKWENLINDYYNSDMTIYEIATKYHVPHTENIYTILANSGLQTDRNRASKSQYRRHRR